MPRRWPVENEGNLNAIALFNGSISVVAIRLNAVLIGDHILLVCSTELGEGDCREILPTLPSKSVQCVVTSPPYWGLRSYLPPDHPLKARELGQEPTVQESSCSARSSVTTTTSMPSANR